MANNKKESGFLFTSKEHRDSFIKDIIRENKYDWLCLEVKNNDSQYGNHLAWALTTLCDMDANWFKEYQDDIIEWLPNVKTQGIKRSVLRAVIKLPLSQEKEGEWVDYLFEVVSSNEDDVAVIVNAMEILSNYVLQYPELSKELYLLIEDGMPYYKASLKSRGRKVMKKLNKVLN